MEIQRTANAGVRLTLDGVSILLDGLCERVAGYLPTPPAIAQEIFENPPDVLAFTHHHPDHCSESLLLPYRKQNLRPILGPESLYLGTKRIGEVTITPVESRHLGKVEPDLQHVSYIIKGSRCIWFAGDAAPLQWKEYGSLPRPDVLIAPYAYCNTNAALRLTESLTDKLVLLHLPERTNDPYQLWNVVNLTVAKSSKLKVWIPEIGERIHID